MSDHPGSPHRRSIRLPGYNYAQAGAYFVTLITHQRQKLFGEIVAGNTSLSLPGLIVKQEWTQLPRHFPALLIDAFVVMPDHFHGIIILKDVVSPASASRPGEHPQPIAGPPKGSLGAIVGQYKARVSRQIWSRWAKTGTDQSPIWQRNYYEHIIRSENELNRIRQYIYQNPSRWPDDPDANNPR